MLMLASDDVTRNEASKPYAAIFYNEELNVSMLLTLKENHLQVHSI